MQPNGMISISLTSPAPSGGGCTSALPMILSMYSPAGSDGSDYQLVLIASPNDCQHGFLAVGQSTGSSLTRLPYETVGEP